jgi:uncharacterized surface protein with fasciclin (FAS1) repeats
MIITKLCTGIKTVLKNFSRKRQPFKFIAPLCKQVNLFIMSKFKKVQNLSLLLFCFISLVSCSIDDNGGNPATNTIAELVANTPNLSMLQSALERAGMESALQGSVSITLMAPTNTAFTVFLANANFASIDEIPVPVLEQLLLNHVLGARVDESILRAVGRNYTETRAEGPVADSNLALFFDATGATIIFNGHSEVEEADIAATNGVIHIVDEVINLPTIATFIQSNDAFDQLTLALTTATPGTNFMTTLSSSTKITLFAPPDLAFDDLLDSNPDWTTVNDIEEGELTSILEHHLLNGALPSSDISNNDTATTLEGDMITFSTADGGIDITDGSGNANITVVVADIMAINGVLHATDKVLQPDTSN